MLIAQVPKTFLPFMFLLSQIVLNVLVDPFGFMEIKDRYELTEAFSVSAVACL
jgi:hypothetical protein